MSARSAASPRWRERLAVAGLLLAAIIHLLPGALVLGAAQLHALYGVQVAGEPELALLLRHRAVLLALVGAVLLAGAVRRSVRPLALLVGLASVLSFLWLADGPALAAPLRQVVAFDLLALAGLALGCAAPGSPVQCSAVPGADPGTRPVAR